MTTVLENKGKTVVASWQDGQGKVIWSGLNLPYHVVRFNNSEEVKFFQNIITDLIVGPAQESGRNTDGIARPSSEKLVFNRPIGSGILVKEQFFDGWKATGFANGRQKSLRVYNTGPANPGYMYVPLGQGNFDRVEVGFSPPLESIIVVIVWFFVVLWSLDEILGMRLFGIVLKKIAHPIKHHTRRWWEREDEE